MEHFSFGGVAERYTSIMQLLSSSKSDNRRVQKLESQSRIIEFYRENATLYVALLYLVIILSQETHSEIFLDKLAVRFDTQFKQLLLTVSNMARDNLYWSRA